MFIDRLNVVLRYYGHHHGSEAQKALEMIENNP
jgi:hypothetical protein